MTNKNANRRTGNKPKNINSIIRSAIIGRAEKKYYTFTPASAQTATNGGVVFNLTRDLIEGDNVEQRSGRKVQSVEASLRISANLPTLGVSGLIRFIWFADQMNTGVLPAVSDILDSAAVTSFYSLNAVSNGRFTILQDKVYNMVAGGANQHVYDLVSRKKQHVVYYNGSTAANTANGKGAQFLLVITDLPLNAPVYTADYSMKYVDI